MSDKLLRPETVEASIRRIRGQNVLLDSDLARLYGVETGALVRALKRNSERFPSDFAFQLSPGEEDNLRCQFGISRRHGGRRFLPYAFTEQGVAMLSSVLRSPRAIAVNIEIMRTFVALRRMLASNADLACKLDELEQKYDAQFRSVFQAIRDLMAPPVPPRRKIGFGKPSRP